MSQQLSYGKCLKPIIKMLLDQSLICVTNVLMGCCSEHLVYAQFVLVIFITPKGHIGAMITSLNGAGVLIPPVNQNVSKGRGKYHKTPTMNISKSGLNLRSTKPVRLLPPSSDNFQEVKQSTPSLQFQKAKAWEMLKWLCLGCLKSRWYGLKFHKPDDACGSWRILRMMISAK